MSPSEILVHAAAPSRGSDDARYRKEAWGILGFEAVKRHVIVPEQAQNKRTIVQAAEASQNAPIQDVPHTLNRDSITSTDPAPRHQLTGAFATWVTPTFTRPFPQVLVGRTPAPSFHQEAPAVLVPGDVLIKRTPADQYRPRTAPSCPSAIQETPNLRRALSDSFETPPSVIPDSQPTPPSPQNDKRRFEENSSPSPTHRPPPNAKRKKLDVADELEEWTQPEDTSTPLLDNPPQATLSPPSAERLATTSLAPPHPNKTTSRRQVFPPPPQPGLKSFSAHLTPALALLQQNCARFIQKVQPQRPIGTLERGHWRFTVPAEDETWDSAAREKMWSFLERFIRRGQAGWGVWAVFEQGTSRNEEAGEGDAHTRSGDTDVVGDTGRGVGQVTVYCWGEVVPEIYAMLVLATNRKIKSCGALWVDSAGDVVVDMGRAS